MRKLALIVLLALVFTGLQGLGGRQRYESVSTGLIAHWKMNDNLVCNVVIDEVGVSNGTYHGTGGSNDYTTVHSVAGKINQALDFDGTQDYIEIADHDDFTFGDGTDDSPFSISAWIYTNDAACFEIVGKSVYTPAKQYEWFFDISASKLTLQLNHLDGSAHLGRDCSLAFATGQWYHVVATYDGRGGANAEDGIKLYVDGVRKDDGDSHRTGTYTAMDDGTAPVWISQYADSYSNGLIDNVMIFNTELTPTQVSSLYNSGRGTEAPDTLRERY